jgi:hypothetical protein
MLVYKMMQSSLLFPEGGACTGCGVYLVSVLFLVQWQPRLRCVLCLSLGQVDKGSLVCGVCYVLLLRRRFCDNWCRCAGWLSLRPLLTV